jgi:hypothetical protein
MARRQGLSYNDVLACLDVLSDVDSEHEDDIEDSSNWDESDPESNEMSDSYSEIRASESDSEEKQDGDSREILGKDGYVWSQKPKLSEHQCEIFATYTANTRVAPKVMSNNFL